jgi:hypothetical protein
MALVHGKVTFVSLDGDDLSTYSNNVEFERMGDSHDVTVFGKDAHVKQGGLLDGTATISGFYDSTASTGPRAVIAPIIGTVVELVHRPEGTGSSLPEDTVDVLVTKYTESSPVADMVTWSVDLELSDDVDTTAQSA